MATTNQDQQRVLLLQAIFNVILQQQPPHTVLYPGAGSDIFNPYISTHATDYTFVDNEADLAMLKLHIQKILGPHTVIAMPDDQTMTAGTITIHLCKMNYKTFVQSADNRQYDVLFDKDSWLQEDGEIIVPGMLARLRDGGVWITNTNLGGTWVKDLLHAVGLQDASDLLGQVDRTFGFSKVRVYRKQNFNMDLFKVVYGFCSSITTICNTLDKGERIIREDIDFYENHLNDALSNLKAYPSLEAIAKQICNTLLEKVQVVAK